MFLINGIKSQDGVLYYFPGGKKSNHVNRLVSSQSLAAYDAGPATLGGADLGCCEFELSD